MTREEIIEWLESPEGELWSSRYHSQYKILVMVKDDYDPGDDVYLWTARDLWERTEMVS